MKLEALKIQKLETERLLLIPYSIEICENILLGNFDLLYNKGYIKGKSWPDEDVLDTIPRIRKNLSKNNYATGFESWLIIKKNTNEIIGDLGFKGYQSETQSLDIGYGIIAEERGNGYAEEASKHIIQWALTFDFINEITANCLIDNFQSIKLLKKLDFIEITTVKEMIYWSLSNNKL
ncbi:GNAT family N-acetyltransferase [Flavobacterium ardleyense]|uniref:GNAT family N-acetyltransferase n=1 Tax=Flavobacterium ardleyense TaxID=2038737 RepID=A0ABW5Z4D5_9FLAO